MNTCKKCGETFPNRATVNGKEYTLHTRKYCLKCSPIGTRHLCGPKIKDGVKAKGNYLHRTCPDCNRDFVTKNAQVTCPSCKSKKVRNKRKSEAIMLMGGKCAICGYDKCQKALSFHHIDEKSKSFTLAWNWEKELDALRKELEKCVLLCCRCHTEVHEGLAKVPIGPVAEWQTLSP